VVGKELPSKRTGRSKIGREEFLVIVAEGRNESFKGTRKGCDLDDDGRRFFFKRKIRRLRDEKRVY